MTLTEVLVVIGIIGIMALVTIPALSAYQKITKLSNEAKVLATNLRFAQQLAITQQNIYAVKFILNTADKYQIINKTSEEVVREVILNPEVSILTISNLTDNEVNFTPIGGVTENGTIELVNSNNKIVTIDVKPSGYVQITE